MKVLSFNVTCPRHGCHHWYLGNKGMGRVEFFVQGLQYSIPDLCLFLSDANGNWTWMNLLVAYGHTIPIRHDIFSSFWINRLQVFGRNWGPKTKGVLMASHPALKLVELTYERLRPNQLKIMCVLLCILYIYIYIYVHYKYVPGIYN